MVILNYNNKKISDSQLKDIADIDGEEVGMVFELHLDYGDDLHEEVANTFTKLKQAKVNLGLDDLIVYPPDDPRLAFVLGAMLRDVSGYVPAFIALEGGEVTIR